nr:cytochrome P450 CYP72A219-like [Tanacetum cinerariifolium]
MTTTLAKVVITIVVAVVLKLGWKLLNWAWLMPKKLEKLLREQGYNVSVSSIPVVPMDPVNMDVPPENTGGTAMLTFKELLPLGCS